jgi:hypothetical protein
MAPLIFDYSNGCVFIQDGTIYYSPNSNRPVLIRSRPDYVPDPFYQGRFDASAIKQPIWWSYSWAWLSFIPLAPSFVSAPFEPLCAMPRIEKVSFSFVDESGERRTETRFRMSEDFIERWFAEEKHIVEAALIITLRYGINGSSPPKPSSFHFDRAHKSHPMAKRMICLSREWFVVWMGYLSYLIAKTSILFPNGDPDRSSPLPDWYNTLRNRHGFSLAWLDGLLTSTVCTFDRGTPRAGIVFEWSTENENREPIEWYYNHHIPLHFVWSRREEQLILGNRSLAHLQPPDELVKEALTQLFSNPNLPLPGLICKKYFRLGNNPITNNTIQFLRLEYAPSLVFDITSEKFLAQKRFLQRTEATADASLQALAAERENERQADAQAASSFPIRGLQTKFQDPWKQFSAMSNDWAASSSTSNWGSSSTSIDWAASSTSNDWPTTAQEPGQLASFMPTTVQKQGKLFNHYNEFFAARKKRQEELIELESPRDRQRRESREKQPAVISATMFVWEKTHSSGGCEVYRRVKVNKKENEQVG